MNGNKDVMTQYDKKNMFYSNNCGISFKYDGNTPHAVSTS